MGWPAKCHSQKTASHLQVVLMLMLIKVVTMRDIEQFLARLRSVISELERVSCLLEGESSDAIGFFDESRKR